jgi:hypothetical protein
MDMEEIQEIQKVNLLVQDQDFSKLNQLLSISEFNLFNVLDIKTNELSYSKILAWLLKPQGNHGLNDKFLREFLKRLYSINSEYFTSQNIEYVSIDCLPLENVICSVEQTILSNKRVDILIKIDSGEEKWVIVLENKIKSIESPNQTENYFQELSIKYPNHKKICVFLTPEGNQPSCDSFLPLKWQEINTVLFPFIQGEILNPDVKIFLTHFYNSIKVYLMNDEETERLIKNIYDKYGETINFLTMQFQKYGLNHGDITTQIGDELEKDLGNDWGRSNGTGWCQFYKKNWEDITKIKQLEGGRDIAFFSIQYENSKLFITFQNYLAKENEIRTKFPAILQDLIDESKPQNLPKLTLKQTQIWYRENISGDLDNEDLTEIINRAKAQMLAIIKPLEPFIDQVFESYNQ